MNLPAQPHPRNPLHGVKLETIVQHLVSQHGWAAMGERIPIRCFQLNPSVKSSLTFLRKTPWARGRVERWYVEDWEDGLIAPAPAPPAPQSADPSASHPKPD